MKIYKYIMLNSKRSEQTEERLNAASAEGFTVDHVIQGLRTSDIEWRYPALILSKDVAS
jgi:hypothetical protein